MWISSTTHLHKVTAHNIPELVNQPGTKFCYIKHFSLEQDTGKNDNILGLHEVYPIEYYDISHGLKQFESRQCLNLMQQTLTFLVNMWKFANCISSFFYAVMLNCWPMLPRGLVTQSSSPQAQRVRLEKQAWPGFLADYTQKSKLLTLNTLRPRKK